MQKPTILAFVAENKKPFEDLAHAYDFLYFKNSFSHTPTDTVNRVLAHISKEKKNIHGVIGVNDDTSILASLAAKQLGLIGPSPQSLLLTQHKGLFTPLAKRANPEMPDTHIINRNSNHLSELPYPGFIRLIKSNISSFAYMINSQEELLEKSSLIWHTHHPVHPWYLSFFQSQSTLPDLPPLDSLLYQRFIEEEQFTVDGVVQNGTITLLGITKSVYTPDRKSFQQFDFPAELPEKANQKLYTILSDLFAFTGYDNAGFNVEFFVTKKDEVFLIEMNTRISNQFVPLMKQMYTRSNIEFLLDIALGKNLDVTKKNTLRKASSFPVRVWQNHYVRYVPDKAYYEKMLSDVVLNIRPLVKAGTKLSDYPNDAYSYRYAFVDIAGDTQEEINVAFEAVQKRLGIVLEAI